MSMPRVCTACITIWQKQTKPLEAKLGTWKMLKQLLWPQHKLEPIVLWRIHDFTKPSSIHWAGFDMGDNYGAHFTLRTNGVVKVGDEILVTMRSGRVGRYRIFSGRRDFTGRADYRVEATAIGYADSPVQRLPMEPRPVSLPTPKVTALLGDGTWSTRSDNGKLSDLSGGTPIGASELWKVHARNEAGSRRSNPLR